MMDILSYIVKKLDWEIEYVPDFCIIYDWTDLKIIILNLVKCASMCIVNIAGIVEL